VSKVIERVVKSRLTHHLSFNNLFNPSQSAYCKHHSIETALLYIHDHLINATGSQKISCLCLLDLSTAFDTIDHSILITRYSSWFGSHGSVLNWFKSYLSSRSFRIKCDNHMSSPHTCSCGVPQGSVPLGPLLFFMYTTPKHLDFTVIFESSPLCRWHSTFRFFLSIYLTLRTLHHDALQDISFWMTANPLSFNTSKTKFLLIGLKQQLAKFHNCPIETTHSWHYRRWIPHLLRPNNIIIQILLFSYPCTSLYPSVSWLQNCQYYFHIYRSLQTWLLQLSILQFTKFSYKSTK